VTKSHTPAWKDRLAPDDLRIIQLFVNTHEYGNETEQLSDPPSARRWLATQQHRIELSQTEHAELLDLREALRLVLLANAGHAPSASATGVLHRTIGRSTLHAVFDANGTAAIKGGGSGYDRFVSTLAAFVVTSSIDGRWYRMKACNNDECRVAFYDHSKNGTSRYCSTATCANRVRQRAFRQRTSDR
jgi:predicted RNA-binding Zn ribbon-like protein